MMRIPEVKFNKMDANRKFLFIPGPVDVEPDVLDQMKKPLISHRSEEFSKLLSDTVNNLKKMMFTDNNMFVVTSSSTGIMEAAIRNCVADKCLFVANGAFGRRWYEMAIMIGKEADLLEVEWGQAITADIVTEKLGEYEYDALALVHNETSTGVCNPIYDISKAVQNYDTLFLVDATSSIGGVKVEVDKLGIDVCLTASQKALGLPPGLSICSVSDKAIEKTRMVGNRGYYFDFLVFLEYWRKKQTPSTPAIPLINALNYQLEKIFAKGLDNRFKRHEKLGRVTRKWAKRIFELFSEEEYASNTLTCIRNSISIDLEVLINKLWDRGYIISNGYGKLKNKTFRIAHMGDRKVSEVEELFINIEEVLSELVRKK